MNMRVLAMALVTVGFLVKDPVQALPPDPGSQAPAQTAAAVPSLWLVETVAKGKVGHYSSIQLDDAGWPHIAYYDYGNGDLRYAYKDASGWHFETVDSAGNVGGYPSLALDELGQANISYCLLTAASITQCDDLKYAIKLDGVWHKQTIVEAGGPADKVGAYSSLAVEGGPNYEDMSQHIGYYDETNGNLKYCFGTGAFWACQVVDSVGDVGRYSSLALASGRPHIAYQHYISSISAELKVARFDGSQWRIEKVDGPSPETGGFSSLDLCAAPIPSPVTPHIGYARDGGLGWAYFHRSPTIPHWDLSTIDEWPPSGISLELDAGCKPHMSYYENHRGDLRYYYVASDGPRIETVDGHNHVNLNAVSSLALDQQNQPHISFYDDADFGNLCYAHKVHGVFLPLAVK